MPAGIWFAGIAGHIQARPFGRSKDDNRQQQNKFIIQVRDKEQILPGRMLVLDQRRFLVLHSKAGQTRTGNNRHNKTELIGQSPAIKKLRRQIARVAISPSSILIRGESGSGKEVVARMIHESGNRADHPFVAINCAAIPEQLLESELFGYAKGAFTGASSQGRDGLVKKADGGTLFLDEIGDMSLHLQAKLLRVLDRREIIPVGTSTVIPVDIRVISASHQDFDKLVKNGKFREDLFYRLNVIPLNIAPLRNRTGDVSLLTNYFLDMHAVAIGVKKPVLTDETMECLNLWHWPGNVRELANTIEYLVNMAEPEEPVTPGYLPAPIRQCNSLALTTGDSNNKESIDDSRQFSLKLEEMEKYLVNKALQSYGKTGSKQKVADELGIGIATLYRKIKKYNLEDETTVFY
ncbi:sigma 54-interacting transcriptional regulator [Endozoicomonas sp. Mp262]|uniref:sigma-54 interaction domain-containing protein n=1 Tax=Endozoicomonas sp. Mp262 TaxID=2919499 RepID=UPI0021D8D4A2